ncbi:PucR family transcriptional regulator [Leucobacter sp. HNU]|uniref:PucR family transcriptional regulator n=1 Tax=Leucobacter sp. HNU TaxID=3236805 RepID=UPI003A80A0AB
MILTDSFERSSVPAGTPIDDLRSIAAGRAGVLTAPRGGGAIVICEASELSPVLRIVREHGIAAGVSERGAMADLDRLIEQADQALERARVAGGGQTVEYRPSMQAGVLRLLDADPEARRAAEGLLAPVRQHDAKHGDSIAESLRVWLAHHGQTSPAAAALGVHRHTLRARVQTAESLLQRSLDDPDTRAELWAALRVIGEG